MKPYTPEFYEGVHFYPAYKQDGKTPNLDKSFVSYVPKRQFAKPDTAAWVGEIYKADRVYPGPYLGMGEAFDAGENSVQQYHVEIRGVPMTAGEIAWYFTQRAPDADPADTEAGMWPHDLAPDLVMAYGKREADKWVQSTIEHTDLT